MSESVRIGLLGCGNVGAAFVNLVNERASAIAERTGIRLSITKVAVRNAKASRGVALPDGVFVTDVNSLVEDPNVDLIVEVMGGISPAREAITAALGKGKPVVTANKALLAETGAEMFAVADATGVDLLFEAAVAGGIPFIRPLRESLRGEPIGRVMGIVNGTTNFILSKMTEEGADYTDVLREAQRLGFAEADPTADVEAFDAASKCAIIASIAFAADVRSADVHREGITSIGAADIAIARRLGYVIKLLAIAERTNGSDQLSVRVHPAMVPATHPLASVRDAYNAVFVEGAAVGSLMFYGRGAGGDPTASAVLGDVIDAAVNLKRAPTPCSGLSRARRSRRSTTRPANTCCHSRFSTNRACCTRSPECLRRTVSASVRPSRSVSARAHASSSSPTPHVRRRCSNACANSMVSES